MKKNLGQVDRVARIFIGAVILLAAAQFASWWGLLGLALIISGAVGYCGLYEVLKIKTCCKDNCCQPATSSQTTQSKTDSGQQPPTAVQK